MNTRTRPDYAAIVGLWMLGLAAILAFYVWGVLAGGILGGAALLLCILLLAGSNGANRFAAFFFLFLIIVGVCVMAYEKSRPAHWEYNASSPDHRE